jgi:hypothetical protein
VGSTSKLANEWKPFSNFPLESLENQLANVNGKLLCVALLILVFEPANAVKERDRVPIVSTWSFVNAVEVYRKLPKDMHFFVTSGRLGKLRNFLICATTKKTSN